MHHAHKKKIQTKRPNQPNKQKKNKTNKNHQNKTKPQTANKQTNKIKRKIPKRWLKNSVIRLLFSVPVFLPASSPYWKQITACFLSIISWKWLLARVKLKEHSVLTWRSVRNHLQNQSCLLINALYSGAFYYLVRSNKSVLSIDWLFI